MTPEQSVAGFADCVKAAQENGLEISGSISMPFGSPWDGRIAQEEIDAIIDAYLNVGITEISLSDTSGMGFVFIFSLVLCNSTPLLDNGSFERLAGSPNRRSEPAPRQQAGVPKSLKTSATVSGSLHRYKNCL